MVNGGCILSSCGLYFGDQRNTMRLEDEWEKVWKDRMGAYSEGLQCRVEKFAVCCV